MKNTAGRSRERAPAARGADPSAHALSRKRHRLLGWLAATRFYRHTLIGRAPANVALDFGITWPGDESRGKAIAAGAVELAGKLVRNPSPRWFPAGVGEEWLAYWHGFDWLVDLLAAGPQAREAARDLMQSWLAEDLGYTSIAWRSDVLATRLFAWIVHLAEVNANEDGPFGQRVLQSLAKQSRHLARTAAWEQEGAPRLRALKGLVAATVVLRGPPARLAKALAALEREIRAQILPDGGHRSRSPSLQLLVLRDLIDIRAVLRAAKIETPRVLREAIDRMPPMLRLFRHGDRRMALFNGSFEEDGVLIDLVLTRSENKERALCHAPYSGFERLQADKSCVVVDTGGLPPPDFGEDAHAGALSFEMSCERQRIIVNCGAAREGTPRWRQVARATAAHSVLVVADTNSAEVRDDGVMNRAPTSISCERAEDEGKHWISATHDGYRERFGLTYTRELFLNADGNDLRGEERLTGRPGAKFAVRFHLHPAVQASLLPDAAGARLRLPTGANWRMRATGAEMTLGDSIYLGSGEPRKTQQIVLSGAAAPGGTAVRWALRREPPEPFAD